MKTIQKLGILWILTILAVSCEDFTRIAIDLPVIEVPSEPEPSIPGEPGTPGEIITIIKGYPNVIAQYSNQENNEFVNWIDGSVMYLVYDEEGQPAPNAIVQGIPSLGNKTYTADANGMFIIPKDELPVGFSANERFGSVKAVTFVNSDGKTVTKESARNTYVPCKIDVKIEVVRRPFVDQIYTIVSYQVMRRIDVTSSWEPIPNYLGDLDQWVYAYELRDGTDPASFDESSQKLTEIEVNISQENTLKVYRPTLRSIYFTENYQKAYAHQWDGQDHYFNLKLHSYYGESPNAGVSIKRAPVQFCPYIKDVECKDFIALGNGAVSSLWGEFSTDNIDYSIIFEDNYAPLDGVSFNPVVRSPNGAKAQQIFRISFSEGSNGSAADVSTSVYASVDNPEFEIQGKAIYTGSLVSVVCMNSMFRNPGSISKFDGHPSTGFTMKKYTNDQETPEINVNYIP